MVVHGFYGFFFVTLYLFSLDISFQGTCDSERIIVAIYLNIVFISHYHFIFVFLSDTFVRIYFVTFFSFKSWIRLCMFYVNSSKHA